FLCSRPFFIRPSVFYYQFYGRLLYPHSFPTRRSSDLTDVTEVQTMRSLLGEIGEDLGLNRLPPLGAMIETPASALLAQELAEVVDFFSIGTNDLTQYVLAMDREHSDLAARIDGLHPAVLRIMRLVAEAASARQREVAVCGSLASDPAATAILIGLGIRDLSCVPSSIPS